MIIDVLRLPSTILAASIIVLFTSILLYLVNLNHLLGSTPEEVKKVVGHRWTREQVKETYERLCRQPVTTASYASQIPPKLHRRYIITGGSGIVGGYIVLQLLERGQPPHSIRIIDFQAPHRADQLAHPAFDQVDFKQANISSAESTRAGFDAPWDPSVAGLPLTVFHTAAVIIPSARSELVSGFCESVNVGGTENVLSAARMVGADVLVSTSSASISIRPVELWVKPWEWNTYPKHFWQVLEESDFFQPIRRHNGYYGNYPASKAKAERIVCGANGKELRTGCIRPANGIYGHPTDNTVGGPLNSQLYPSWATHVVHSFVHGINCALAHLHFEAILANPGSHSSPQAGRPFCVTDPNPPIYYEDLYSLISQLATTPFKVIELPPVPMLLLSYCIECYNLLPARFPRLARFFPPLPGSVKHLQPGLFSICTHLVANNGGISEPADRGGLGHRGVLTSLEGMCQELIDWNNEQEEQAKVGAPADRASARASLKWYRDSVSLAEEIQRLSIMGNTSKA